MLLKALVSACWSMLLQCKTCTGSCAQTPHNLFMKVGGCKLMVQLERLTHCREDFVMSRRLLHCTDVMITLKCQATSYAGIVVPTTMWRSYLSPSLTCRVIVLDHQGFALFLRHQDLIRPQIQQIISAPRLHQSCFTHINWTGELHGLGLHRNH